MTKYSRLLLSLLIAIALKPLGYTQRLPSGPQVLTFHSNVDDTEQPYGLYLPSNYDENKKYPLLVMLHGAGSNHRLALRRVFGKSNKEGENDVEASKYFPEWKNVEYIVVSPFARGTAGYQGIPEKDVWDVVDDAKKRFNIDENRTYLTGLSMGGGGTLWIGLTRPDVWAAIAPVCPAPPTGSDDLAPNALNIPVHFFHGDKDQAVPVDVSRTWVKKLKESGTNVEYVEYPGIGHNSWENAYKDGFIFDWFSKFTRNPFPDEVRFVSLQYKYNKAYWVRIDGRPLGAPARLEAKFTGDNKIDITIKDIWGFTLKLAGHSKFKGGEQLLLTINGKKIKAITSDSISVSTKSGKWVTEAYRVLPTSKVKGAEGPINEAFSSRHIYVYGTLDNPGSEELKARIDTATKAANWSQYRNAFLGRIMVFPRIVADKDVSPSDLESSNLILFGNQKSNAVIEKYKTLLPIQLTNTKEYGLFYIFPNNGNYIVINSGLPWWTGTNASSRFQLPQIESLSSFKDYILFKKDSKSVVLEGSFDNNWKLSVADVKVLKASGVVEVAQ